MGLDISICRVKRKRGEVEQADDLATFRKMNFLIPFFENWLGIDIENCAYNPIDIDACKALCEACNEVLEHHEKAEEILPTEGGFFFGSTEYDEWYFDDLNYVKKEIEENVIPAFDDLEEGETIDFWIWY